MLNESIRNSLVNESQRMNGSTFGKQVSGITNKNQSFVKHSSIGPTQNSVYTPYKQVHQPQSRFVNVSSTYAGAAGTGGDLRIRSASVTANSYHQNNRSRRKQIPLTLNGLYKRPAVTHTRPHLMQNSYQLQQQQQMPYSNVMRH